VRSLVPHWRYVSLETPAAREFARSDPASFLASLGEQAVIDEAQHAPEIFSEIQTAVDASGRMGRYILTGSQNLQLLASVSQSLAGRSALVELFPLSVSELRLAGLLAPDFSSQAVRGFFPAIHDRDLDPHEWLQGYLVTYAERDARTVAAIQDLGAFQRLLRLTAARTGQLLNMQSLASDTGVSDKTVRHWLCVLETCYLVHFVRPHLAHFGKRLVKMPKLYMTDVGLAAALLGIREPAQLDAHPLRGPLFETLVVNEFLKNHRNAGLGDPLWFWRDNVGTEVDLVLERGHEIAAVEIKSGPTVASDAFSNLRKWRNYARERGSYAGIHAGLVYGGRDRYRREDAEVLPWTDL
jgi:uncharacterized protein